MENETVKAKTVTVTNYEVDCPKCGDSFFLTTREGMKIERDETILTECDSCDEQFKVSDIDDK